MTSPKYSANKLSAKNDLKRSFGKLIIPSIISFLISFYYFVVQSLTLIRTGVDGIKLTDVTSRYRFILFSANNVVSLMAVPITMIVVGVLFSFASYYQIMRKSSVNFFFSSPVDRRTYFRNRVVASISLMAATAFVPVLCDVIINIHYFSHADVILYQGLLLFLEHFVNMLVGFSLMSISMMLCYTITESLVFGAGLIWFPTLIIYSINYVAQVFLRGYEQSIGIFRSSDYGASNALLNKLSLVNPVFFCKRLGDDRLLDNIYYACCRPVKDEYSLIINTNPNNTVYDYSKSGVDYILPVILWIALSAVFILIAQKLLVNRKLENTSLHASRPFVTEFVSFEASFFLIGFFIIVGNDIEALSKNKFLMVFLALVLGFAIYFVVMSISRRSVKHSFKLLAPAGACVLLAGICTVVCNFGAFGYATYVPSFDKIEYASVSSNYFDASGVMSNNSFYENSAYDGLSLNAGSNSFIGKFTDESSIKKIEKIQKYAYENEVITDANIPSVTVFYHLKSGEEVSRVFYNTNIDIQNKILGLTKTKEYKDELEFLLSSKRADEKTSGNFDDSRWDSTYFSSFSTESDIKYGIQNARTFIVSKDAYTKTEIENTPALRDAILKDLESLDYKDFINPEKMPLGAINFKYDDTAKKYNGSVYASDNTYYIFDNMTNTLAYLKSVNKLDALNDTSSIGKLQYVVCAKTEDIYSVSDMSLYVSLFESKNINEQTYTESTGDEFDSKEFLSNYNPKNKGMVIKNADKAKKLFDASSIFSKLDDDSYILLFKCDNGIYLSRYLSKENAQKYLK